MPRVAVVTGGTRGIGRAIAVALKSAGYRGGRELRRQRPGRTAIPRRDRHPGLQVRCRRLQCLRCGRQGSRGGARAGRDPGQQRRHHPRHDDAPHDLRAVERGDPDQPHLVFQHVARGHRGDAHARLWPHRQHRLDQRSGRAVRPGQLRRGQIRHPRLHQGARRRKGRGAASRSTRSPPATSIPTWCARCRPRCWKRSSHASRSAASARPRTSPAPSCSWSPTTPISSPARPFRSTAASTCIDALAKDIRGPGESRGLSTAHRSGREARIEI